ncbi:hypothetical protein LG331_11890 [Vreelandella aquamarina]|uniref:hypothetical protein n=1 Tax=Vreelandella aquamarina TaxID=77097 RepID=UPI00384CD6F2
MTVAPNSIQTPPSQPEHGNSLLTLVKWLSALHGIQALPQLTLLGAGSGQSEVLRWAEEHAIKKVSLVEASQKQFKLLSATWQAAQPQWQLHNMVLDAGFNKTDAFYIASNIAESGLMAPETLTYLWPNITEKESQPCEPVTLAEWAKMHWQSSGQWLFIDYFCDASLLTAHADVFQAVDVLGVRISTQKGGPEAITAAKWESALKQAGFRVINRSFERHPGVERWLCIKQQDGASSANAAELVQTKEELKQVKEKLENTHTWFMNRKQQALEYEKQVALLESTLKATQEELAHTRQQAQQMPLLKEFLDQLAQQVTDGFAVQSEQRRLATNALGKHITQMLQPTKVQPQKEEKDNL